jgi:hypothetical protein
MQKERVTMGNEREKHEKRKPSASISERDREKALVKLFAEDGGQRPPVRGHIVFHEGSLSLPSPSLSVVPATPLPCTFFFQLWPVSRSEGRNGP